MPKISEMRKQETLDKIMKTASELFSKRGYHNTQVMDIVRAVGISAGTFYNYFKDKRDLFERIAQDNFENRRIHVRKFRRPFNIWDRNEEIRMLRESYTTLFDFVDQYPEIMLMLFRGGYGVDEAFDLNTWNSFSSLAHDLAEDVQAWLDAGIIAGVNPMLFGHAVVGLAMEMIHSYIVEQRFTRAEAIDAMIRMNLAMFDVYLTGKGKNILQKSKGKQEGAKPRKEPYLGLP